MSNTKVFIDEFKGHDIFAIWNVDADGNKIGNYPVISFGINRAKTYTPILEHAEALQSFINEQTKPEAEETKKFTYNPGDRIEIKTWLAKKLGAQLNMDLFFRNLEITETLEESRSGIRVKVKFVSEVASACHVCGLPLDTEISRACGIGPVCCKRMGIERPDAMTAPQILAKIEEFAKSVGEVGPVWIAKSQIKDRPSAEVQDRINNDPQVIEMLKLLGKFKRKSDEWFKVKTALRNREAQILKEAEDDSVRGTTKRVVEQIA